MFQDIGGFSLPQFEEKKRKKGKIKGVKRGSVYPCTFLTKRKKPPDEPGESVNFNIIISVFAKILQ